MTRTYSIRPREQISRSSFGWSSSLATIHAQEDQVGWQIHDDGHGQDAEKDVHWRRAELSMPKGVAEHVIDVLRRNRESRRDHRGGHDGGLQGPRAFVISDAPDSPQQQKRKHDMK